MHDLPEIRKAVEEKEITIAELSEVAGVWWNTTKRHLDGSIEVSAKTLRKYGAALDAKREHLRRIAEIKAGEP